MRVRVTDQTPEMIAAAYNHGTLSKVREFIDFYKRLDKSLMRQLAHAEEHRLRFAAPAATTMEDFMAAVTRLPSSFHTSDRTLREERRQETAVSERAS